MSSCCLWFKNRFMIKQKLASQGEYTWKALELLKNGSKTCAIIQSQTPLQTSYILFALFFIRTSSNFGWIQPEVSFPFCSSESFLIFSLCLLRGGGVESRHRWTGEGSLLLLLWPVINRSIRWAHVLPSWELSRGCLLTSCCCSEVVTEVLLCALVYLCLFFIFLLTSSPSLGSSISWLRVWGLKVLVQMLSPSASSLLQTSVEASSHNFDKAEIWPWNFVFPFLFHGYHSLCSPDQIVPGVSTHIWHCHQSLLLTKVFRILPHAHSRLSLKTKKKNSKNRTSEEFTLTYMWFPETEPKDECRKEVI